MMRTQINKKLAGMLLMLLIVMAVSVTAMAAAPEKVTGLTAAAGDGKVHLSWDKAGGADKYWIYGCAKRNGTAQRVMVSGKTSAWISKVGGSKLVNGHRYYFYVMAMNAEGFSLPSETISVKPVTAAPGNIKTLNAFPGIGQVTLKWSRAAKATGYRIYYRKSSGGKWSLKTQTKKTSAVISGLTNGTRYDFTVRAIRTKGSSTSKGKLKTVKRVLPSSSGFGSVHSVLYTARVTKTTTLESLSGKRSVKVSAGTTLTISRPAVGGYFTARYNNLYWLVDENAIVKTAMHTQSGAYDGVATGYVNGQRWTSNTNYLLWISAYSQRIYVFIKSGKSWTRIRTFLCATGKWGTQSQYGKTRIRDKARYWIYDGAIGGEWASKIAGGAIHSGGSLGAPASHGCVRVAYENAKWIYDTVPIQTTVYIY